MNLRGWAWDLVAIVVTLGGGFLGAVVVGLVGAYIAAGPGGDGFLLVLWLLPSAFIGFWIGVSLASYGLYKFNRRKGSPI